MTCGLHTKFDKAVDAVKEALHAAIDTKDFNRSTLSELWRHYQGLQTISEGLPEHKEHDSITFDTKNVPGFESDYTPGIFPDGCYDPDGNITLDPGVNITLGDAITSVGDAITWNNEVFNEPITFEAAPPTATQSGELPPTTIPTPRTTNPIDPEQNAEDLNNRDGD